MKERKRERERERECVCCDAPRIMICNFARLRFLIQHRRMSLSVITLPIYPVCISHLLETDRERPTETDKDKQRQTETDRQRQTDRRSLGRK